MTIVMVKKRLASGEACKKCDQAEAQLTRRGLWQHIDKVVWAIEGEEDGLGWELARQHQVETAPFFLVGDSDSVTVYISTLALIREVLTASEFDDTASESDEGTQGSTLESETAPHASNRNASTQPAAGTSPVASELATEAARLAGAEPIEILAWALERFGGETVIAFSGAEDVVLIDMAATLGLPFTTLTIDTGRLHPETYEFVDWVRERYQLDLLVTAPASDALEELVRGKGLFSFYRDGHAECCSIRKVAPLRRALVGRPAWITGQRRDQNHETRSELQLLELDMHLGTGVPLVKINPLVEWSAERVWDYIRLGDVPHNPLHGRGFASIGCAPCTRPILPGQGPRDGRWWWESSEKKECGLHWQNVEGELAAPPQPPSLPKSAGTKTMAMSPASPTSSSSIATPQGDHVE